MFVALAGRPEDDEAAAFPPDANEPADDEAMVARVFTGCIAGDVPLAAFGVTGLATGSGVGAFSGVATCGADGITGLITGSGVGPFG
jgi:hypothetical protein